MSKSTYTFAEMFESLDGFEEIAVEDRLGMPITDLAEKYPMRLTRGLIYIELMRSGTAKADAWKQAMALTLGGVKDWFSEEPVDVLPDEPDSEAGKEPSPGE